MAPIDADTLRRLARTRKLSEDRRAQVVSLAYGNLAIERPDVTREQVERAVNMLFESQK